MDKKKLLVIFILDFTHHQLYTDNTDNILIDYIGFNKVMIVSLLSEKVGEQSVNVQYVFVYNHWQHDNHSLKLLNCLSSSLISMTISAIFPHTVTAFEFKVYLKMRLQHLELDRSSVNLPLKIHIESAFGSGLIKARMNRRND